MVDESSRTVTIEIEGEDPENPELETLEIAANQIEMIPGVMVWKNEEAAGEGSNCLHLWIWEKENSAKCVFCEGVRTLSARELTVIETASKAGVNFLKWEERLREIATSSSKQRRRAHRKGKSKRTPKSTGGVKTAAEVPEGYIPVKEAAAQLNTEPKKLRRQLRAGAHESLKVGGRVYVKINTGEK